MAGRSDIQAGSAFVRLYVKNNELIKGLKNAGERLTNFGAGISVVGGAIAGIGSSLLGPILAASDAFAESGDQINKMSQRTGAGVSALAELRYAAGQSGTSLEDLEGGMVKMSKAIDDARAGSKGATETMRRLGVSMGDLDAPPEAQLELFADRLASISDPSEKAALAMEVFGKKGTGLLPLFADGAKGIRDLRQEAVDLGLSFGQDQADQATALGDAWDRVKSGLAGAVFQIGGALAPTLTDLLGIVKNGVVILGQWIRQNSQLFLTAAKVGAALVIIGTGIAGIGALFIGAGAALTGFATILTTIGTAIGTAVAFLASGPGIIVAAVVGGVTAFATLTNTGREAVSTIVDAFWSLLDTGKLAWGGIVDALVAGDLALAGQIAIAGLNVVWQQAVEYFDGIWQQSKFLFLATWNEATAEIGGVFLSAFYGVQTAWVATISALESVWLDFRTALLNGWQSIQQGIGDTIIAAAEKSGAVSKEFADAWRQSLAAPINDDIAGRTAAAGARQQAIADQRNEALAKLKQDSQQAQDALRSQADVANQSTFDATIGKRGDDGAAIADARKRLAESRAKALVLGTNARASTLGGAVPAAADSPITAPSLTSAQAATGTFSAAAAAALGSGGGVQERIAKAADAQAKILAEQKDLTLQLLFSMTAISKGLTHS